MFLQPKNPGQSFLWHSLVGFHLVQFLFFLGIYLPALNPHIARLSAWLDRDTTVTVDDSWRVFNLDCKVRPLTPSSSVLTIDTPRSTRSSRPSGRSRTARRARASPTCATGSRASTPTHTGCARTFRSRSASRTPTTSGSAPASASARHGSASSSTSASPSPLPLPVCRTTKTNTIPRPYALNVPYRTLFARFEAILASHGGRPHWAKSHPLTTPQLRALYPRFDDFVRVLQDVDPTGVWRNAYVERHIFDRREERYGPRVFKRIKQ